MGTVTPTIKGPRDYFGMLVGKGLGIRRLDYPENLYCRGYHGSCSTISLYMHEEQVQHLSALAI